MLSKKNNPLTFKYVVEPLASMEPSSKSPEFKPVSLAAPVQIHRANPDAAPSPQSVPSQESNPVKTFKLWMNFADKMYSHKTTIRQRPIHGRWPAALKKDQDFMYYALREVVPDSMVQHGLCDWSTGGQLSDDRFLARTDEKVGANMQAAERIARRRNREMLQESEHELVSWTSVRDMIPKLAEEAAAKKSESALAAGGSDEAKEKKLVKGELAEEKAAEEATEEESAGERLIDGESETISEPLRMGGTTACNTTG